jgi:hypothetical protein
MKKPKEIGALSENDRALVLNAKTELEKAQAVWSHVSQHIARQYRLAPNAEITEAGDIMLVSESVAP